MSERIISIAIPTYNRNDLLFDSFEAVIDNDNVGEIVIVDDVSKEYIYDKIKERADKNEKIKLFRNEQNLDCFFNKHRAIELCTNDWAVLLDSDNKIDFNYLYRLFQNVHWEENTAYLPSFAAPHFDYRKFEGLEITSSNVSGYMNDPTFTCMLNTCNYFINRKFYLKCWTGFINPYTSDSIYMNYLYLKNGGKLYVVPGLTYQHRVDNHENEEKGHYQANCHKTGGFHQEVEQMLKELK